MAEMIVETDPMNCIVITNAQTTSLSAIAMEDVYLVHTNAMETKTVRMGLMKLTKFVVSILNYETRFVLALLLN